MADIMLCNFVRNPFTKLSYFNKGRSALERAVAQDPTSVELRYLRFTVQTNVPALLNYRSKLNEDKKILLAYVRSSETANPANLQLQKMIATYLLKSGFCNEEEKSWIRKYT
jgi:hypothetical protein